MVRRALKACVAPLRFAAFLREEDGIVSVITAIAAFALLGVVALSFDLGRAWNLDTQLQSAADASALACASQLDRSAGARARATTAATNGALAQNSQNFATDGAGATVAIPAANVTFYSAYANGAGTAATNDADATFCKVVVSPRTVNFSFAAAVAGPASTSPSPSAVAAMNIAKCAVPPMMVCNPSEPPTNTDLNLAFDVNSHINQGLILKASGPGAPLGPGNFGLLALDDHTLSTNEIRDAWGRINPLAQCFGERVTTKPGQATATAQGLNVRFEIFEGGLQAPAGEPAVQSNPQYTPAMNTGKGLTRTSTAENKCGMNINGGAGYQEWKKPTIPFDGNPSQTPAPTAMGFPRDTCAYPGGTCATARFGDGTWAIAKYFEVNHSGVSSTVVPDLDGDGKISRYEVYQWELDNYPNNLPHNATSTEHSNPTAAPQCHSAPEQTNPDRRVLNVAVVNCAAAGLGGSTQVSPVSWIRLFVTEPMGSFDGNNDLYSEVAGPAEAQNISVNKYVLRLVE
jgi:Flp pilus assembly protein TadG